MVWSRNRIVELFDGVEFFCGESQSLSITRGMWACALFRITAMNTDIPSENLFTDSNF